MKLFENMFELFKSINKHYKLMMKFHEYWEKFVKYN